MGPKPVNLQEHWVICRGLPIHYWSSKFEGAPGEPALIHLHGFGISGKYMLPTADLLAAEYRTLVPDLPGYGRSVRPEKVQSIPELADAVLCFMDVLDAQRATLVGNSMGCIIAIETARLAPERIDRLVLVSPAGGPNNRPVFKGVAQLALDGLREPPRMFTIAVPDYLRFGALNAGKLFWEMIHYPTVDRFQSTAAPTLIVLGERDPLVNKPRIAEGTVANDHIQLVLFEEAAHAINYSHPVELSNLIRHFLKDEPLSAGQTSPGPPGVLWETSGNAVAIDPLQ